jgi:hypothetical protein
MGLLVCDRDAGAFGFGTSVRKILYFPHVEERPKGYFGS